jgi:hypothetical protein
MKEQQAANTYIMSSDISYGELVAFSQAHKLTDELKNKLGKHFELNLSQATKNKYMLQVLNFLASHLTNEYITLRNVV